MAFYSREFLVFLALVGGAVAWVRDNEPRKWVLLAASCAFCAWASLESLGILLVSALVTYRAAEAMAKESDPGRRRALLAISIVVNLLLLGSFKYADFARENVVALGRALGFDVELAPLGWVLPLGISFYTLQAIGYAIEVHRRPARAAASFSDFLLYLAFFPRFAAGPILRASAFLPQLAKPVASHLDPQVVLLFLGGLAKKVLIADNLAPFVDGVYADVARWPGPVIWLATVAFAVQIYCDFSGYTDMAIAIGRLLGYRLPENFHFPFLARNPSDLWRRWHVSFSSWLRDYVYGSLPGAADSALARWRNILVTMVLAGIWHGASWGYVLWGFSNGILLVAHDAYGAFRKRLDDDYQPASGRTATILSILAAQACWISSTVFFRAPDVATALAAYRRMFGISDFLVFRIGLSEIQASRAAVLILVFFAFHVSARRSGGIDERLARKPLPVTIAACVLIGFLTYFLWPLDEPPFVYQRF